MKRKARRRVDWTPIAGNLRRMLDLMGDASLTRTDLAAMGLAGTASSAAARLGVTLGVLSRDGLRYTRVKGWRPRDAGPTPWRQRMARKVAHGWGGAPATCPTCGHKAKAPGG